MDLDFLDDFASPLVEALVATGHVGGWAGDLGHEHWLEESGLRLDLASVHDSSGSWDDLTTTSMDRIVVKFGIHDIESAISHFLSLRYNGVYNEHRSFHERKFHRKPI